MDTNKLLAIFYVWSNIIAIIVILIIFQKNMKHKQTRSRCLSMVMFHLFIYFIGDSIWAFAYFKIFGDHEIILRMSRMIYYSASDLIAFAWLMYVLLVLNPNLNFKRVRKIFFIPTIISLIGGIIICAFLNPAQKDIYGYLTALSLVLVPFTYIIGSGVHVLVNIKKFSGEREKRKLLQFAIWPIVIMIFSLLQVFIPEIPIYCFGAIIVTVYLFIQNQDSFITTDTLTGVYNREMMNRIFKDINDESNYYLLMLDIDKFKKINDTYGHLEGDKTLKHFANLLKETLKTYDASIIRYGGDEFLVIIKLLDQSLLDEIINSIQIEVEKSVDDLGFKYTTSIGYNKIDNNKSYDENIAIADELLYKNKELSHQKYGR